MKNILLVEDDPVFSVAMKLTLKGFGYGTLHARTGEAAVEQACGPGGVDLVLMDIDLGAGIDGTEAARRILARRDLPIVFLSSHTERQYVEKVRGLTRYGYVAKDAGDFVLQSSIEMAFDLFEAHESLRASEARLSTLIKTIPDLVWLKDTEGVFLACNAAFESFFGAPESEIVGKTDYDFLDAKLADFFLANDRAAMELGGRRSNEEWITYASDGHRALLETIKTPMVDAAGKIVGVLGIGRDITEHKRFEESLKDSEASVQRKLNAIVEPGGDPGDLGIRDIVDIAALQALMEDFSALTGMCTALLDSEGRILVATGWKDICTKFHRGGAASAAACTESDLYLASNVKEGEYVDYRCANGLWDVVTPLRIEGRHIGNIYTGQFFYDDDVVDEAAFAAQARRHGFDEAEYLAALSRVPRFSRATIARLMGFLVRLTVFVSRLSYSNLSLSRTTAELRRAEGLLSKSVEEKETLLRELPHRVKNSLAIISSFLRLNMPDISDEGGQRVFQEAINRVCSVAMIYEKLSESAGSQSVDLAEYIASLLKLLESTYAAGRNLLRVRRSLEPLSCDLKRSVSIGLIFNELFTNALKYAYRPGEAGEIRVGLSGAEGGARLWIEDDGPGFPPGFDPASAQSLGLKLSKLLADGIEGRLSFEGGPGARVSLEFKLG